MLDLQALGWDDFFRSRLEQLHDDDLRPARVAVAHGTRYELLGSDTQWAELTGRLRHDAADSLQRPAVGDWVAVARGRIHHVLERKTRLVRQGAGERTGAQVVAANVDVVFVVSALDRDFNPRRIERYLTVVWDGGARPVLVLNKADACGDIAPFLDALGPVAMGVPVVTTSALAGTGTEGLQAHLGPGITAALVGSSGVGKSTLINHLLGREALRTGHTRAGAGKGRHITTHRELLPLGAGGMLIDTPGMRELGLWDAGEGLRAAFADIDALAARCRFRDCTHQGEPGCAVTEQVPAARRDSFARLVREQAHQEQRQQGAQARHNTKQRWKQATKAMRAHKKLRPR